MKGRAGFGLLWFLPFVLWAVGHAAQAPGRWVTKASMPTPRTEVAAAVLGGKIYVIGGFGGAGGLVEVYDPGTDRWETRAPLPEPLHHTTATSAGSRLYVIGGYSGGWSPVNGIFEYDPASDRWRRRVPMPTARHGLGAAVIGRTIYVIGGGPRSGGSLSDANEAFFLPAGAM